MDDFATTTSVPAPRACRGSPGPLLPALVYMCLSDVREKKKKEERIRENEHFNFPIKSMPQYESLFAFLH